MAETFSLQARLKSFAYAFNGIIILFREQHNARLHGLAVFVVVMLGVVFDLDSWEWAILTLTMAIVLAAEALNTAVEYLADACMPDHHPLIAKAKDVAAAAVLLLAVAAIIIALIIFFPYFLGGN